MKFFIVSYMGADDRWITCGRFRAHTASGALRQFAKDLRHFPDCKAIRAEVV